MKDCLSGDSLTTESICPCCCPCICCTGCKLGPTYIWLIKIPSILYNNSVVGSTWDLAGKDTALNVTCEMEETILICKHNNETHFYQV